MDRIDEFESMFKRAERERYQFEEPALDSVAVITDGTAEQAETLQRNIENFLPRLTPSNWRLIVGDHYQNVAELLGHLAQDRFDLLITFRCLQEKALVPQHSLGVYLDVLTQAIHIPVLVLPGSSARPVSLAGRRCDEVMVITDHISGDSRLVNYAVRMCNLGGTVLLCHVEDDRVFERYMQTIERIPEIETDMARTLIDQQLLKEASDFIATSIAELQKRAPELSFRSSVVRGHRLQEYRSLVDAHEVDLLVANTKDDTQLAMSGMAYSMAVEFDDIAILLL